MTEHRVTFLHKIISSLPQQFENNESLKRLRSYYLMRCQKVTSDCALPNKHFSSKIRCSHCYLEWNKKTQVNMKSIKLSSRQRRRIRHGKIKVSNKDEGTGQSSLLNSNQMEQTCSFCKKTTVTAVPKSDKIYTKNPDAPINITNTSKKRKFTELVKEQKETNATKNGKESHKKQKKMNIESKMSNTNLYSNAFEVFSLKNKQNTLASTVKEAPKVIKNNKKKKDKFAGLCQKAVLASVKLKQEKGEENVQNKLNLFLKPSTG